MVQNYNTLSTTSVFFDFPTKNHYLKGISREIKLAHTSVKNDLIKLKKDNLIIEEIEIKASRKFPTYKANLNGTNYRREKKIYNLKQIINSELIEFIEERLMPKSIILFGSYQKGEDIETSDLDLFVECKKEELDLKKFERKLKRSIELHFSSHFNDLGKELKNNILNGVILFGYLEVFK